MTVRIVACTNMIPPETHSGRKLRSQCDTRIKSSLWPMSRRALISKPILSEQNEVLETRSRCDLAMAGSQAIGLETPPECHVARLPCHRCQRWNARKICLAKSDVSNACRTVGAPVRHNTVHTHKIRGHFNVQEQRVQQVDGRGYRHRRFRRRNGCR